MSRNLDTFMVFHAPNVRPNEFGDIPKDTLLIAEAWVGFTMQKSSRNFEGMKATTSITFDMTLRSMPESLDGTVGTDEEGNRYEVIRRLPSVPPRQAFVTYEVQQICPS